MNNVKSVLAHLRESLGVAEKSIEEAWQLMMRRTAEYTDDTELQERENCLREGLSAYLKALGNELALALEMIGLPETRRDFLTQWDAFDEQALKVIKETHGYYGDVMWSDPLILCRTILQMIEARYESETEAIDRGALDILDYVLESTPQIMTNYDCNPTRETDIQKIMHKHLERTFQSFTRTVTISKQLVSFKPDCGITDLHTAIEFKFVDKKTDLKTAIHGLTEDLSGYAGSLDWTKLYAVIYQTQSFEVQSRIRNTLQKSGNAEHWRIYLVTGHGSRSKKP